MSSQLLLLLAAPAISGPPQGPAEILETACIRCHNPTIKKGELDISTRPALLAGGESGAAVVLGKPADSRLFQMVTHEESPGMPLREPKLSDTDIATLRLWIEGEAPYTRALVVPAAPVHWAYASLATPARGATIDRLLGGSRANLASADRRVLVRRATFDAWGLPPTPDEVVRFLADRAPTAWARLVDRLLAAPAFGERWARHWLDVARYADSAGFESDTDRAFAYPYRDFVIRAFNDDLPFDQFVKWQLAGDEFAPDNSLARAATGFLAAGEYSEPNITDTDDNKRQLRYDELDDLVGTTGAAFLGLTVACARCHDHKFDAISAREYYGMAAAFATTQRIDLPLHPGSRGFEEFAAEARRLDREARMEALAVPAYDRMILRAPKMPNNPTSSAIYARWGKALAVDDANLRAALDAPTGARWDRLRAIAGDARSARALMATDTAVPMEPVSVLRRGDARLREGPAPLTFFAVLGATRADEFLARAAATATPPAGALGRDLPERRTFRRAALAEWLVDVERGAGRLVARVIVNRLWQHHFGAGLVENPNDLGSQSAKPEGAAVLDFLAARLIEGGFRLKPIHRLIMTSRAYQRRGLPPRRLEAEALRDSLLAVSGTLNQAMYGPAIKPPIDRSAMATRAGDVYPSEAPDRPELWRRAIYIFHKRSVHNPLLEVFDAPVASASCGRRSVTTVPTQALTLLNDGFVRARAEDFAVRLASESAPGGGDRRVVERAFWLAYARPPSRDESRQAQAFIAAQTDRRVKAAIGEPLPVAAPDNVRNAARRAALADFAHAIVASNEFAFVD